MFGFAASKAACNRQSGRGFKAALRMPVSYFRLGAGFFHFFFRACGWGRATACGLKGGPEREKRVGPVWARRLRSNIIELSAGQDQIFHAMRVCIFFP